MNRRLTQIATLCLGAALLGPALVATPAHASSDKKQQKRNRKLDKTNPLANVDSKQPDKQLFDKAMVALKKGKYDVARLDLQTLLNTYPDSEYQMRAKLAVGDSWFKEGGSAAYTQAEAEYKDFITFFPNAPEAAEAQMKVADIYFMQMEKPDRDHTNVDRAEEEYRQMIQQVPDSTLVPRAKQRLREVQEVEAQRQFEIGSFYASHENWMATIARLQTVADTYPLFSHSDLTLIQLGDAYSAQARAAAALNIKPEAKAELVKIYNDRAAHAYARVVTRYAMAPHVEDAKDRLIALNYPVPEPTKEQLAESEAEEASLSGVKLKDRAFSLIKHGPTVVQAARVGEPTLTDPAPTLAPAVYKNTMETFNAAITGKPVTGAGEAPTTAASAEPNAAPRSDQPAAAPALESVPSAGGDTGSSTGLGAEIIKSPARTGASGASAPGEAGPVPGSTTSGSGNTNLPAPGVQPAADPTAKAGGLKAVGPADTAPLAPVEKPAAAADQINDVKSGGAQVNTATSSAAAKKKKQKDDLSKESSSRHKKKKGIDKINPF
jgi:outer membrane protein assembly factor BamD